MTIHHQKTKEILVDLIGVDESKITPDAKIKEDLDMDSLDIIELVVEVESQLDISIKDSEVERFQTMQDVYDVVSAKTSK